MPQTKQAKEIGFVTNVKGYLMYLDGLPSISPNDILIDDDGRRAIVVSLEKDNVTALLLDQELAKAGNRFFKDENGLQYIISNRLFGRIIDSVGKAIDGKTSLPSGDTRLEFDVVASGISSREEISEQFVTGVSLVDTLFPIGKGQRQLLFGPTSSGKTRFIRDLIINQKGKNVVCIYVGIGKPSSFMHRFAESIFAQGAADYTILVGALAEATTPMVSIAPSVGFLIAEHFRLKGNDVLLILDDLGTHAKYLRETALFMGRIPGRQSYPGDIFYEHAHLLERAGNFNDRAGGGSITVIPVIETDIENFTDLIPTNLMATTDGHLFFSPERRAEGYYPSIAIDRSVTRVGRQTQLALQKELATRLMMLFVEHDKQKEFVRFGTGLSAKTKNVIKQGEIAHELLKQETFEHIDTAVQVAFLSLTFSSFLLNRELSFLRQNKINILNALRSDPELKDVRHSALHALSLNEFLELLNKRGHIIERVCQR